MKGLIKTIVALPFFIVLVVAFSLGSACLTEGYNPLVPDIDTCFSEGYSESQFDLVMTGMDSSKVVQLVGSPLSQSRHNGELRWHYSSDGKCEWMDFAWLNRSISFDTTGRVIRTHKAIYYD